MTAFNDGAVPSVPVVPSVQFWAELFKAAEIADVQKGAYFDAFYETWIYLRDSMQNTVESVKMAFTAICPLSKRCESDELDARRQRLQSLHGLADVADRDMLHDWNRLVLEAFETRRLREKSHDVRPVDVAAARG